MIRKNISYPGSSDRRSYHWCFWGRCGRYQSGRSRCKKGIRRRAMAKNECLCKNSCLSWSLALNLMCLIKDVCYVGLGNDDLGKIKDNVAFRWFGRKKYGRASTTRDMGQWEAVRASFDSWTSSLCPNVPLLCW